MGFGGLRSVDPFPPPGNASFAADNAYLGGELARRNILRRIQQESIGLPASGSFLGDPSVIREEENLRS